MTITASEVACDLSQKLRFGAKRVVSCRTCCSKTPKQISCFVTTQRSTSKKSHEISRFPEKNAFQEHFEKLQRLRGAGLDDTPEVTGK